MADQHRNAIIAEIASTSPMYEKIYTPEDLALILDIHIVTVYRNLAIGRLPGVKIGSAWRIPKSRLDKYLGVE